MRELARRALPTLGFLLVAALAIGALPVGQTLWAKVLRISGSVHMDDWTPTPTGTATQTATETSGSHNCTYTLGFWKNHPDAWLIEELVLGGKGVGKKSGIEILNTPPKGDATYILVHQLIAAKLNILAGADPEAASLPIDGADAWLIDNPLGSNPEDGTRAMGIDLADALQSFNEGASGPGHCDDEPEELTATPTPTATPTSSRTPAPTETTAASGTPLEARLPDLTGTATPSETPEPTSTETAEPTATQSPTETLMPTETETATDTPVPTPTDTPEPPPTETLVPTE
jgi:hypothetical protein